MLGGLHWYDLLVLVILALVVFGPKRLPEMGSAVGKTIKEFQKSMREVTQPTQETSTATLPAPNSAATVHTVEPQATAPAATPDTSTASAGTIPAETRPD